MLRRPQHAGRVRHFWTALVAMLLLLAGHVPVSAFTAAAEGMTCCQDGHSCCRRAHHHSAHHESGPEWQAQRCGGSGCGVHPGTTAVAVHVDAKPANIDQTAPLQWRAPAVTRPTTGRRQLTPNLFQRPPPFSA